MEKYLKRKKIYNLNQFTSKTNTTWKINCTSIKNGLKKSMLGIKTIF